MREILERLEREEGVVINSYREAIDAIVDDRIGDEDSRRIVMYCAMAVERQAESCVTELALAALDGIGLLPSAVKSLKALAENADRIVALHALFTTLERHRELAQQR